MISIIIQAQLSHGIPRTRCNVACIAIFKIIEAVQQFKIGRKESVNKGLNSKRRDNFEVKHNCGAAPILYKNH